MNDPNMLQLMTDLDDSLDRISSGKIKSISDHNKKIINLISMVLVIFSLTMLSMIALFIWMPTYAGIYFFVVGLAGVFAMTMVINTIKFRKALYNACLETNVFVSLHSREILSNVTSTAQFKTCFDNLKMKEYCRLINAYIDHEQLNPYVYRITNINL